MGTPFHYTKTSYNGDQDHLWVILISTFEETTTDIIGAFESTFKEISHYSEVIRQNN